MDQKEPHFDDYTLAAFMAGTLPESRRKEVAAYLARNANARELLHLAYEAMDASHQTERLPQDAATTEAAVSRPAPRTRPAQPRRPMMARLVDLRWYVAAACLVFSLGLGLRMVVSPAATPATVRGEAGMSVEVAAQSLRFQWATVADAYQYRVTVWDPSGAAQIMEHTTQDTFIASDAPALEDLRAQLVPGQSYALRVDAVNAQNRTLKSSDVVTFMLHQP